MSMNWIWLDRVSLKCKKFIFPSLNPGRIFGYICIALSWFLSDDCADVSFQFVCWYSTSKCIRYIIYIIFTYIYTQIIWDMPSTRLLPTLTLRSLTSRKWKGFEMHWIGSMHCIGKRTDSLDSHVTACLSIVQCYIEASKKAVWIRYELDGNPEIFHTAFTSPLSATMPSKWTRKKTKAGLNNRWGLRYFTVLSNPFKLWYFVKLTMNPRVFVFVGILEL